MLSLIKKDTEIITKLLIFLHPPRRNYMPTAEIENKMQKNIPVYFVGDLNVHLPAMGYGNYNTNGREIKETLAAKQDYPYGPRLPDNGAQERET